MRTRAAVTALSALAVTTSLTSCGGGAKVTPPQAKASGTAAPAAAAATANGVVFTSGGRFLRVEAADDDMLHFELGQGAPAGNEIVRSPMIDPAAKPRRAPRVVKHADGLEVGELRAVVDTRTLCVKVTDTQRKTLLHQLCPGGTADTQVAIDSGSTRNVYGLGEQFLQPGTSDGDWMGKKRTPGVVHGNAMVKFDGSPAASGSVGNAQFPVLYALGEGRQAYAVVVDDVYAETWDFTATPWTLRSSADARDGLRWYVIAGDDLPDLRRDVMHLLGRPPVPPRKAFGLWVSEYGYDDWKELDGKLASLRKNKFPVDGFVLDLQWFGSVQPNQDNTRMGTLTWDRVHFPEPEKKIAELRDKEGIGLILIEESYVGRGLPEHAQLAKKGFLAKDCAECQPTYIDVNPWWGKGGMLDWSNGEGADWWHDQKRQPLVEDGVLGHWCDLGEPEMYSDRSWYAGVPQLGSRHGHADIHNLFTLLWVASIERGYKRHGVERRPFTMVRSGTSGLQRYGASMWSGDIGTNLTTLATHLNAQLHMSMSGIDYFGSDIGGFIRNALRGDLDETYTQWLADGLALDVPARVHTWNTENDRETAPDRVGHVPSNLANVRRRYQLVPYLYSLAHHAWLEGDPVFPPLVWAYPEDPEVRRLGGEKLVGRDLLVATVARDGAKAVDVYLPRGRWADLEGAGWHDGGAWLKNLPLRNAAGILALPMFARAGAILPLAHVDDRTWNVMGKRADGAHHDELRARVFAGSDDKPTSFTLYEDDGETVRYQRGDVRATRIEQRTDPHRREIQVTIGAARGTFQGAVARRDVELEIITPWRQTPARVFLGRAPLPAQPTREALARAPRGWFADGKGKVLLKTGEDSVDTERVLQLGYP